MQSDIFKRMMYCAYSRYNSLNILLFAVYSLRAAMLKGKVVHQHKTQVTNKLYIVVSAVLAVGAAMAMAVLRVKNNIVQVHDVAAGPDNEDDNNAQPRQPPNDNDNGNNDEQLNEIQQHFFADAACQYSVRKPAIDDINDDILEDNIIEQPNEFKSVASRASSLQQLMASSRLIQQEIEQPVGWSNQFRSHSIIEDEGSDAYSAEELMPSQFNIDNEQIFADGSNNQIRPLQDNDELSELGLQEDSNNHNLDILEFAEDRGRDIQDFIAFKEPSPQKKVFVDKDKLVSDGKRAKDGIRYKKKK